jgi:hypothetical protein
LSTAWNDDACAVAVRCQNGPAGFRFAGGVGYMKDRELKFNKGLDCAFDPMKHTVTRLPAASWQGFVIGAGTSSEGDT